MIDLIGMRPDLKALASYGRRTSGSFSRMKSEARQNSDKRGCCRAASRSSLRPNRGPSGYMECRHQGGCGLVLPSDRAGPTRERDVIVPLVGPSPHVPKITSVHTS